MKEDGLRRIERLLERDKEEMTSETKAAALREFCRVANEYFETEGDVTLAVSRERSGFSVSVTFRAGRVKNFTVLAQNGEIC